MVCFDVSVMAVWGTRNLVVGGVMFRRFCGVWSMAIGYTFDYWRRFMVSVWLLAHERAMTIYSQRL